MGGGGVGTQIEFVLISEKFERQMLVRHAILIKVLPYSNGWEYFYRPPAGLHLSFTLTDPD